MSLCLVTTVAHQKLLTNANHVSFCATVAQVERVQQWSPVVVIIVRVGGKESKWTTAILGGSNGCGDHRKNECEHSQQVPTSSLLGCSRRNPRLGSIAGPVKFVQKPMENRRSQECRNHDENQTSVQRVEPCEELSVRRLRWVNRAHAAKQHGAIEKGVPPREPFIMLVTNHAES